MCESRIVLVTAGDPGTKLLIFLSHHVLAWPMCHKTMPVYYDELA